MKAVEIIILLAQLSDIREFLDISITSEKTPESEKEKLRAIAQPLSDSLIELRAACEEQLKSVGTKSPFDEEISLSESQRKIIAQSEGVLEKIKKLPGLKGHIHNIINFRKIFFVFLESEKRFVDKCHQITEDNSQVIKSALQTHYYGQAVTLAKIKRLEPVIDEYRNIKNHLDIDINTALNFSSDPFSAIHFLHKQLVSCAQNDYDKFETISVNFKNLYDLVSTACKGLKNGSEARHKLEPLVAILSEPFHRMGRYPMFFKDALKSDQLTNLAHFYEEHHAKHHEELKEAIQQVQKTAKQMGENIERLNAQLKKNEEEKDKIEAKERRDHFLSVRANLDRLRAHGVVKASRGRLTVGLLTHYNGDDSKMLAAAHKGKVRDFMSALEEQDADINGRDSGFVWGNYTALIIAACLNHRELVEAILSLDLGKHPVNTRAQTGTIYSLHDSALHWAAHKGFNEIVLMLVLVDPGSALLVSNQANYNKFTPLHMAICANRTETATILLNECGAELVTAKTAQGITALQMAYDKKQKDLVIKMITMLLGNPEKYKTELDSFRDYVFKNKKTPRKSISMLYHKLDPDQTGLLSAARTGDMSKVIAAHEKKVDLNCLDFFEDSPGFTPLMHASAAGQTEVVRYLIDSKVQTRTRSAIGQGDTALHLAVEEGHTTIAEELIRADNSNLFLKEDRDGYTPLHTAVKRNVSPFVIDKLLSVLPVHQLKQTANDGVTTPFRLACIKERTSMAKIFLEAIMKSKDNNLIQQTVGYCLLKVKFTQYASKDPIASEMLLSALDKATPGELIMLLNVIKTIKNTNNRNFILEQFSNFDKVYIDDEGKLRDSLEAYDTNNPLPLGFDGPSTLHKVLIGGSLVKNCVLGCIEHKNNTVTWIRAAGFVEHFFLALQYTPEVVEKSQKQPQAKATPFWLTPAENPTLSLLASTAESYLPGYDRLIIEPPPKLQF